MRIERAQSFRRSMKLARPYEIAYESVSSVELVFVVLEDDRGHRGLGCASPAESVTGESAESCASALASERLAWLRGLDPRHLGSLIRELGDSVAACPAARAAVDMALHDLTAQTVGVPLVDLLGRCHELLPTSITLGIQSVADTLEEVDEHLANGFRCLKVKIGSSLEEDLERLRKIRERVGEDVTIRVDANQGYDVGETLHLLAEAESLALELVEQPLPVGEMGTLRSRPASQRRLVAADESVHDRRDAINLVQEPAACGILNIKLMKCGGIAPALSIAAVADAAGAELMWGCNDESRVSIAAALHAAYASPATRYLDLDGSLGLTNDPVTGGFEIENGCMRLLDRPGLGVALDE